MRCRRAEPRQINVGYCKGQIGSALLCGCRFGRFPCWLTTALMRATIEATFKGDPVAPWHLTQTDSSSTKPTIAAVGHSMEEREADVNAVVSFPKCQFHITEMPISYQLRKSSWQILPKVDQTSEQMYFDRQ